MRKKNYKIILGAVMALSLSVTAYAEPPAETAAPESVIETIAETAAESLAETEAAVDQTEMAEGETMPESESTEDIQVIETIPETEAATIPETETESIAEESEEDDIQYVSDSRLDENGNVAVEVQFPDDAVFPYSITLNGPNGDVKFEITYNGQQLLIKPGTYKVKSVKNGDNKKLDKGARIVITENTDIMYLDFTNPNKSDSLSILSVIITNLEFLLIAGVAFLGFKAYCRYIGIKKGD